MVTGSLKTTAGGKYGILYALFNRLQTPQMISSTHSVVARTLLMGSAAFLCYLSMFAFRKPFAAASYGEELMWFGLELKTSFVLAQLLGYILSKYIGIWWLSAVFRVADLGY